MTRRRAGKSDPRPPKYRRAHLEVERLEERNLLDAAGTAALAAPEAWIDVLPDDPKFPSQYGLHNTGQTGGKVDADIDAPQAWNLTVGSMATIIGVVDTGIDYRHVDLHRNIWINPGEIPGDIRSRLVDTDADGIITFRDLNDARNIGAGKITDLNGNGRIDGGDLLKSRAQGGWADGVSNDGDGYVDDLIGWDFINNDNDPFDDNGHGTHVAGTIGAEGGNGVGVAGVAWDVRLMALKFLGANGSGSVAGAAKAIDYAVRHGAIASNHSWSMGSAYWQPLYDSMARAQQAGHIIVAAAGNGGSDARGDNNDVIPNYPASFNLGNIIAVAATTKTDGLAGYSNYGAVTVDLGAPGVGIYSTYTNNRYTSMGGTSMATPHVTGVVALVHSLHPDWSGAQIKNQILATVDKLSVLSGKTVAGGRLNASRALGGSENLQAGLHVVSLTANGPSAGPVSSLRVAFNTAIDPTTFTLDDVVSFGGPAGAVRVTGVQAVAGSGNRQFDLTFDRQTTPGFYRLTLGPNIRDTRGLALDQDRDGRPGEATQDNFSGSFAINQVHTFITGGVQLPDAKTTRIPLRIDQDITIANLTVRLTLTHPNLSDLYIYLKSPDGTTVVLSNRRGGNGDNFKTTLFDDDAATPLSAGTAPFVGTFRPDGLLSSFEGKNARGTWEIVVEDRAAGNRGRLNIITLYVEQVPSAGGSSADEDAALPDSVGDTLSAAIGSAPQDRSDPAATSLALHGSSPQAAPAEAAPTRPEVQPSNERPAIPATDSIETEEDLPFLPPAFPAGISSSDQFADILDVEQLMDYFESVTG